MSETVQFFLGPSPTEMYPVAVELAGSSFGFEKGDAVTTGLVGATQMQIGARWRTWSGVFWAARTTVDGAPYRTVNQLQELFRLRKLYWSDKGGQMPNLAERPGLDVVFVLDRSGSMQDVFADVKVATASFADQLEAGKDRVALVSFAGFTGPDVTLNLPLTYSLSAFETAVMDPNLVASGSTYTDLGIQTAIDVFTDPQNHLEEDRLRVIVLFSDGQSTPGHYPVPNATTAKEEHGVTIAAIAFGSINESGEQEMQDCASLNGDQSGKLYWRAPTVPELDEIYDQIQDAITIPDAIPVYWRSPLTIRWEDPAATAALVRFELVERTAYAPSLWLP